MPHTTGGGRGQISFFAFVFYLLLALAVLKILKIISDPPEPVDYISLLLAASIGWAGSFAVFGYNQIRKFVQRVGVIENELDDISKEISHITDMMDINTRLARLEAKRR